MSAMRNETPVRLRTQGPSADRLAETLAEHAARMDALLATATDAIITIDPRGIILEANPATERLFGYRLAEMIGQPVAMLMPVSYGTRHQGFIDHLLAGGEARLIGAKREVPARRRDGSVFPAELSVNMAEVGGRRLFIGVLNDITARKQAEVDLARALEAATTADKAMARFLAHISHELRTPLTAILGFAQMMEQEVLGPLGQPAYRAYVSDIQASADKLLGHIDALLDMARLHQGDGLARSAVPVVEMADLLGRIAAEVDQRADRAGLHLAVEVQPPTLAVPVEADVVRRILLPLLDNALKFTERGGAIALRAVVEDEAMLRLDVCDTGCGIPAAHLAHITRPMTPGAVHKADRRRGIGVGLGMVRTLLTLRDGRMELSSVEGQGTRVSCWLPFGA